jgi:hypothetical protein
VTLTVPGVRGAHLGTSLERDQRALEVTGEAVRVPVPAGGFVAVSLDRAGR